MRVILAYVILVGAMLLAYSALHNGLPLKQLLFGRSFDVLFFVPLWSCLLLKENVERQMWGIVTIIIGIIIFVI